MNKRLRQFSSKLHEEQATLPTLQKEALRGSCDETEDLPVTAH